MKLVIDQPQRDAKRRAHTATHLLHALLTSYFPNTKQAGSLVDSDFLRFDFYAETLLTESQMQEIETQLNQYIYQSLEVTTVETSFDEAKKLWAKAFFEDKYGDVVRLVRVCRWDEIISAELCGGTHVSNTREIGAFTILSQEAVASGIKRITAITGPKVIEKIHTQNTILSAQVDVFQVKSITQLQEKTLKLLKEYQEMASKLEQLSSELLIQSLKTTKREEKAEFDCVMKLDSSLNFKLLLSVAKTTLVFKNALFFTEDGTYLILTDGSISAKELWKKYALRGWWSDVCVQGKDANVLTIF